MNLPVPKLLPLAFVLLVALVAAGAARSQEAALPKQLRVGQAVVSLPANWTALGPEIPAWLHLHGSPRVVEKAFASIGAPGVLINITLPGLSRVYAEHFADPGALPALLNEVEIALRREAPQHAWRLGRLTVSSFSAGYAGVRELLKQPAAFERISALVMADSLYCGYSGNPADRRINAALMDGFVRFAEAAADGGKQLVVSHSRQVADGYASTTETAEYLVQQVGGSRSEENEEWPGGLRLLSHFTRGNFDVFGFDGDTAADHLRHLHSLGLLLERAKPDPRRDVVSVAELRAQIDAHVQQARFAGAAWGVKVVSLDSGRTLYQHHSQRLLSPGSNSKLYAAALLLDRLGGDYRIVTPLLAPAAPDAGGVLAGDLVISGRGDPSWVPKDKRAGFWSTFEPFVAALRIAGVRRITGDIIADAAHLRTWPHGAGWTVDDLNFYYGGEVSGVSLLENYAELRITPGTRIGEPCGLELLQPHTGLLLQNHTTTIATGGTRRLEVRRLFNESTVHVFGEMPAGAKPFVEDVTVPRPAQWFAGALREALRREGISVEGNAHSAHWPEPAVNDAALVRIGEVTSPPLRELLATLMKASNNLDTDLLFAHLGETLRTTQTPRWRTSEQLAVNALRHFLQQHNLSADDVRFDEGSGLSRNNLTSADATVALLQFMAAHRHSADFAESLPIAGVDGTLRRRMKGTRAEGNVRAKTGTLRWAHALGGYVTTAAGERLAFSVMLNRSVAPSGHNLRDDIDAIAVMLAEYAGPIDATWQ